MFKVFDLHNDVLTANFADYKAVFNSANAVAAIWTTKLDNPEALILKAGALTNNWAIEDLGFCTDLSLLKRFKPRYVSLTWNDDNIYAGGANSFSGITLRGIEAIKALEGNRIIFDTAHLNERSFFDSIEHTTMPFICSHTCFSGIFNHKRNLTNEQINAIVTSGGIVGLTFVSDFMGCLNASTGDIIKQIEYFLGLFEIRHLCIGTDFYGSDNLAIKSYLEFEKLYNELSKLNYTNEQIERIFYLNAQEFFK